MRYSLKQNLLKGTTNEKMHRHLRFCFFSIPSHLYGHKLFKGHIVAAVCSLGACFLFFALSLLTYKKGKDSNP